MYAGINNKLVMDKYDTRDSINVYIALKIVKLLSFGQLKKRNSSYRILIIVFMLVWCCVVIMTAGYDYPLYALQ